MWMVCENGGESLRTVILRHDLPDGSHHFDWLLANDAAGSLPLTTWRCSRRVDELGTAESMPAERLGDHRPIYLDYVGPVSGDRGHVSRVVTGHFTLNSATPDCMEIDVAWRHETAILTQTLSLARRNGENWIVTCAQASRHQRTRTEGAHHG